MTTKTFHAGLAAALLWAGSAGAQDAHPAQDHHGPGRDATRAAMHEAMQKQMATQTATALMPGMAMDRAAADSVAAREHAAQSQQVREAARQRAMKHGARDAAMASGDADARAGMRGTNMHQGGTMGDSATQGAGMMRTGDMHGGTGGMMPSGGGMMGGSGGMMGSPVTGSTGGTMGPPATGTTSGTTSGSGTTMGSPGTSPMSR